MLQTLGRGKYDKYLVHAAFIVSVSLLVTSIIKRINIKNGSISDYIVALKELKAEVES